MFFASMATKSLRSLLSLQPLSMITSLTESLTPINQPLSNQIRSYKVIFKKKVEEQRIKHRKGRVEGIRDGGNNICFGKYALQALEPARITARQIEAGRKALQLNVRRGGAKGGKVWVRVFAWKAVTSKPAEVRMGRGKGVITYRCAPVQKGQIIYEMGGVMESLAKRAIQIAGSKMPIKTRLIIRDATTKEIGIR